MSACSTAIVAVLWLRVLVENHRHFVEYTFRSTIAITSRDARNRRFHLLLLSDARGIVLMFHSALPPEKAQSTESEETQRCSSPRSAYACRL